MVDVADGGPLGSELPDGARFIGEPVGAPGWRPGRASPAPEDLNDCVACSDFRAQSVRDAGVAPELYDNVENYRDYPGYTTRQRLAIEYAERFATAHDEIDDAFFALLRQNFSDEEVLDLTLCLAVYLGLGRTIAVLGVDQSCDIEI